MGNVIELQPGYASAWYKKFMLISLKGDKEKSLDNLRKASVLDQKFKEISKKDEDFRDDEDFKKIIA